MTQKSPLSASATSGCHWRSNSQKNMPSVGFDISLPRITELRQGRDGSLEVEPTELAAVSMKFTDKLEDLRDCNVYIVTVPTPIDAYKTPDLRPLISASRAVGKIIAEGDVVIYESTVYPGATEEDCIPVIEAGASAWSSTRIFSPATARSASIPATKNIGSLRSKKVTSGSTPEIADFVDALYASIIIAGTHKASSIKVAEAAKVIENTQRDVNIALVNELSLIFGKLAIDTEEVLQAAGTKWNFLPFRPGLVGGHCIGVDPYYLTHKAQAIGYHPAMILAGRRINDGMGSHVAGRVVKLMLRRGLMVNGGRALIMGLTFKENCPDLRNTRVTDIIDELQSYGMQVDVWDPWVSGPDAEQEYGITPISQPESGAYSAIVLAVGHRQFVDLGVNKIREFGAADAIVFDVKYLFPASATDGRL